MARKTYIPDDPSTLFDFELGDVHRRREIQRLHGHRGYLKALARFKLRPHDERQIHPSRGGAPGGGATSDSARLSEEIATNRQGEAARNLNRSSPQSQMDIFDFIG